jgi:hypothetical protein
MNDSHWLKNCIGVLLLLLIVMVLNTLITIRQYWRTPRGVLASVSAHARTLNPPPLTHPKNPPPLGGGNFSSSFTLKSAPNFFLHNPRSTPSGRKSKGERRRKKKMNAINSGHLCSPRSPSTTPDGQRTHFAHTKITSRAIGY